MQAAPLDHIQMFIKVISSKEIVLGLSGKIYGDLMVLADQNLLDQPADQNLLDQPGIHKNYANTSGYNSGFQMARVHQVIDHSIKKSSCSLSPQGETAKS